jgi:hypothetical protein
MMMVWSSPILIAAAAGITGDETSGGVPGPDAVTHRCRHAHRPGPVTDTSVVWAGENSTAVVDTDESTHASISTVDMVMVAPIGEPFTFTFEPVTIEQVSDDRTTSLSPDETVGVVNCMGVSNLVGDRSAGTRTMAEPDHPPRHVPG